MKFEKKALIKLLLFVSVLTVLMTGCGMNQTRTTNADIVIREICRAWRTALPTRSREDTERTQAEIGKLYDYYEVACDTRY